MYIKLKPEKFMKKDPDIASRSLNKSLEGLHEALKKAWKVPVILA